MEETITIPKKEYLKLKKENKMLKRTFMEDSKLTNEEKKLLDEALEDEKKGKLLSSKEVFG